MINTRFRKILMAAMITSLNFSIIACSSQRPAVPKRLFVRYSNKRTQLRVELKANLAGAYNKIRTSNRQNID